MNSLEWLTRLVYNYLIDHGVEEKLAINANLLTNIVLVVLIVLIFDWFSRKIIVSFFKAFSNKTKTTFDDFLVISNFPKYVGHILPLILVVNIIPSIFSDYTDWGKLALKVSDIYMIVLVVWILRSLVKTTRDFLKTKEAFADKPVDSFAQIMIIVFWCIAGLFIFSELTNKSLITSLGTLGAASAIILLVFKDTILGFVASIQVSVNDMVRVGDWITQQKYGADGDVIEINLTTVKVKNFDNTITTIPTYALISDSFQNWRGMQNSDGRRIKRAIYLKSNSIKFLTVEDLEKFSKIQDVKEYIYHRQKDIDKFNDAKGYDKSILVNGRGQTNLGLFRKYCDEYLKNHPALNKDMLMMTRHLPPTPQGIPLEIYAFSSDKRWVNYERIMADVFEHLIAAVTYFDLEIFEYPTGKDVLKLNAASSFQKPDDPSRTQF
ncbi:mechanosensitive ion channel family protein [Neptunitalea lumnitzerae]|uniref:Mechanosensitive ion channel protein MscS n=1 Tax=Neptunitalea lumnitzerae TaxID=2965509 RepID=A0ABQ5MJA9_9FLAO|nr:mechanosensitive ion channel domain-containing protein [Neptunitalea sp. Y10]GLB49506.1 mechanosensitive ion channel protein MscS [Neptunitalea sp. Y10]